MSSVPCHLYETFFLDNVIPLLPTLRQSERCRKKDIIKIISHENSCKGNLIYDYDSLVFRKEKSLSVANSLTL